MPRLRAIIFDLDDTLYPEWDYVLSGFRAVATWASERLGVAATEALADLCRLFKDGARRNTFNRWLEMHDIDPAIWLEQMVQVYRAHDPQIVPYPKVPGLLRRLHEVHSLGLLTDGHLQVQKRKLQSLGLESYFDAVVFTDEFGHKAWKPSPRPFEITLARLGVTGPEAVYIADNPAKDFLGARQACIKTVRVRHPEGLYAHSQPPSPAHAPDLEIRELGSLEAILTKIGHNP